MPLLQAGAPAAQARAVGVRGLDVTWRFEGAELRSARLRVPAAEIEGVHVAFSGGRARAWVETRDGDQVALVEGEEREVRRIADQLSGVVRLASSSPSPMVH